MMAGIRVSALSLIRAGAEKLLPAELQQLAGACQAAQGDAAPLGALADRLDEQGDDDLAYAVRWMAKYGKGPGPVEGKAGRYLWGGWHTGYEMAARLPAYLLLDLRDTVEGTWWYLVSDLAIRLIGIRLDLDVSGVSR